MLRSIAFIAALLSLAPLLANAAEPDPRVVTALSHLRPHPRLLVTDSQLTAVRTALMTDPLARAMHNRLVAQAMKLLPTPPLTFHIGGVEHTLLNTSRAVEGRVMLLAGLYRLDHNRKYAVRAIAEMRSAAGFPNWNIKHFLDTAEMTNALGIGYDWCYDAMSVDDRRIISNAIVEKGLNPGIVGMQPGKFLARLGNNWVQVCNGGLTVGALAVADVAHEQAAQVISNSIPAMAHIMKLFAPDGGFEEGPVYWDYATTFNTYYLAALDTAVGTDFDLSKSPGFSDTGEYRMATISPLRMYANFGDCDTYVSYAAQMFWMARKFNRPLYAAQERDLDLSRSHSWQTPPILELLWQYPRLKPGSGRAVPLAQSFKRIAAAFMRTGWNDPSATYLAFKGGDSRASHGHLDLGHFIAEMAGQRWAVDPGPESYGVPGYFGKLRYTYFRASTAAHNTLTIDSQNESLHAHAPLTTFKPNTTMGDIAIANLDSCYPDALHHWSRGVVLRNANQITIQDEIDPAKPVRVVWHFHTTANVTMADNSATLKLGRATVRLRITSPADAVFTIVDDSHPPVPNSPNPHLKDVQIVLMNVKQPTTISVQLTHGNTTQPSQTKPLSQW